MDITDFLTRLPISSHLNSAAIQALSAELEIKKLPSGAALFAQDDPGDAFYIVYSGKLRVDARSASEGGTFSGELEAGECVGEMALLTGQPRSATVTALEASDLLCLTKPAFERLDKQYPGLLTGLANQALARFQRNQTRAIMKRLFGYLDDNYLRDMLGQLDCRQLSSGEVLFRQGELGDEMYVIVQGRLRMVAEEPGGGQRAIGEVGTGEAIGEFALLGESGAPESRRAATVYATRATDLLVISRPVFENLLRQYPQILLNLTRQIARRAASIGKSASRSENNLVITLIPLRPELALGEFAAQLTGALSALGSTLSLDAGRFEQLYGKAGASATPLDHPLSFVINAWLDEREREHNYVIYEATPPLDADGRLTPWSRRCVEDADVVVLVGEWNNDPALTAIDQALRLTKSRPRLEFVLLHHADCPRPSGTAAWLAPRRAGDFPVQAHYHVRMGNQADLRRMARRVAGKPVGLVFSGGGARGWGHLGVIRAMEEYNLEFDWVAGASMGAIIAAGCAFAWSSGQLRELAVRFANPKKLLDYTFPYAAITSTKNITAMLQELYPGDIEDTWRPFFCVSSDLTRGKEYVHTTGVLWKAVRASLAFPGIFSPILHEGSVLVDGGAANNLPIDRMREMCPNGTVIGVDLITASPVSNPDYDFGPSLSGWRALAEYLSPVSKKVKVPNLLDIIAGVVNSNTAYRLNEVWRCADLLIKVPVEAYGLLEFERYAEVAEAGYIAGREQLKGFKP